MRFVFLDMIVVQDTQTLWIDRWLGLPCGLVFNSIVPQQYIQSWLKSIKIIDQSGREGNERVIPLSIKFMLSMPVTWLVILQPYFWFHLVSWFNSILVDHNDLRVQSKMNWIIPFLNVWSGSELHLDYGVQHNSGDNHLVLEMLGCLFSHCRSFQIPRCRTSISSVAVATSGATVWPKKWASGQQVRIFLLISTCPS